MGGAWGRRVNHAAWGTMAYYLHGRLESTCLSQTASMTEEAFEKHVLAFCITFCHVGLGTVFSCIVSFSALSKAVEDNSSEDEFRVMNMTI